VDEPPVEAFDVPSLEEARAEVQRRTGELYLEFLRRDSMSCGLYVLEAGADDPQEPHQEDEVYLVLAGRAWLEVAGRDHPVEPGGVLFVARTVPHRFHTITERLSVLVFFAPAESA
jgi:mannose-6-phosphate isomerase-like protein (cupin superfamily)